MIEDKMKVKIEENKIPKFKRKIKTEVEGNSTIKVELRFEMPFCMFVGEKKVKTKTWEKKLLNYAIKEFEKLKLINERLITKEDKR